MDRHVRGLLTVKDENGARLQAALVVGRWTRPDGVEFEQYAWTGRRGIAMFATEGGPGTYTLTIVNIVLTNYTFDPSHSVLAKSITIGKVRGR